MRGGQRRGKTGARKVVGRQRSGNMIQRMADIELAVGGRDLLAHHTHTYTEAHSSTLIHTHTDARKSDVR